jgi:hypothetical protein
MKIRTGFVSNSSSSSFCAFGRCFHLDKSKDIDAFDRVLETLGYEDRIKDFEDDDWELDEFLIQIGEKHNLIIRYGGESNTIYCGGDYGDVEGSSTFDEFRTRVMSILGPDCNHINQVIDCAD